MSATDPPGNLGSAPRAGVPVHYGLVVLALVVVSVFGSLGLGRFGYTSVLPAMQESLRLSDVQTGELQSWNLLGYVLTVVFAGLLAARFGPRVVISVSLGITASALILTGLVPTLDGARVGRFLAGVGGAGGNVPAMGLVSAWFGARRRGLATGIGVAGSSVGLMVTGPLVPWILKQNGSESWRECWYVLGALGLGALVLCALFLRNRPEPLGLRPLGESPEERALQPGDRVSAVKWSLVYRSGTLWHLAVVFFGFGFSYIIYSTFFIRYLVAEAGFTRPSAGALWMTVGMVSVISGLIWGNISDRWGRRLALVCVFALQGTSFLVFGLSRAPAAIYLSAALFAVTAWSVPALMAALSGDVFGSRLAPAALGLVTIVFGIGQALGPWVAGHIAKGCGTLEPAFAAAGLLALVLGGGGAFLLRLPGPKPPAA